MDTQKIPNFPEININSNNVDQFFSILGTDFNLG